MFYDFCIWNRQMVAFFNSSLISCQLLHLFVVVLLRHTNKLIYFVYMRQKQSRALSGCKTATNKCLMPSILELHNDFRGSFISKRG